MPNERFHTLRRRFLTLLLGGALTSCSGGSDNVTGPDVAGTDARAIIDAVWRDYDEWYAFFELLPLDWNAIGAAYRDSASRVGPAAGTARLLGGMIRQLHDAHADLQTPYGVFAAPFAYELHFDPRLVQRTYFAAPIRHTPSNRIGYTTFNDGTGYVSIGTFSGDGWGSEIDEALGALTSAPAIIIDIRNNGGGSETIGKAVASRFYDAQHLYRLARFRNGPSHNDLGPPVSFTLGPGGSRQYTRPVAVITSRYNASAAEDFVLMMRVLPHAVIVGDTTRGVGSNPLVRILPNGWTYRIPRSQQSTPEGFVYNWKGLPPTIAVAWRAADTAVGRDPYIEAALTEFRRRTASPAR